jgi:hypothetical protein
MPPRTVRQLTIIGPVIFVVASALLTVAEHGFLVRHGWKPLADSNVNWPSALASGPVGVIEILAFVALGVATIDAARLHRDRTDRRAAASALTVAGVLTLFAACPVDVGTPPHTWHGYVNEISLSILTLLAPVALLLAARDLAWDRGRLMLALGLIAVTAIAFMSLGAWSLYLYYAYWSFAVARFADWRPLPGRAAGRRLGATAVAEPAPDAS